MSNEKWFCVECLSQVFPFASIDQNDFENLVIYTHHDYYAAPLNININACNCFHDDKNVLENQPLYSLLNRCKFYDVDELKQIASLTNNIACIHINVRSIAANYTSVISMLDALKCVFNFTILTETWTDKSNADLYNIPGNASFNFPCSNRKGGGILIFIKQILLHQYLHIIFLLHVLNLVLCKL